MQLIHDGPPDRLSLSPLAYHLALTTSVFWGNRPKEKDWPCRFPYKVTQP